MRKRDLKAREKAREERLKVLKKAKKPEFVAPPPQKKTFTPTIAKAPKLSTLNRSALKEKTPSELENKSFKAAPMPTFKAPKVKAVKKRPLTKPVDFKFRTDQRLAKKETVVKGDKENSFSAVEMPDFTRGQIKIKQSKKTPTKARAPSLNTENRAALKET